MNKGITRSESADEVDPEELLAINERLIIAGVQQQEDVESAQAAHRQACLELEQAKRANETQQDFVHHLVTAREDERRSVSQELHSQTGQHLAGIALGLKSLEETIGLAVTSQTGADLRHLRHVAEEVAQDIHRIAVDLHPTALEDLGLVPALRTYVQHWSAKGGIRADFESIGFDDKSDLPEVIGTAVYRVVQEALTNVIRHGSQGERRAASVSVILQRNGRQLQATVEDDGPGFEVAALDSGHSGVAGMLAWAALCKGALEVDSTPGAGTTVYLRIPLG